MTTPAPASRGRPSTYTPELGDAVAELVSRGMALCAAAKKLGLHYSTVDRWQDTHDDFRVKCASARKAQAEWHHAKMDVIERRVLRGDLEPAAASVVLGNKRWRMERMDCARFGARTAVDVTARVASADLTDKMTSADAAKLYQSMMTAGDV